MIGELSFKNNIFNMATCKAQTTIQTKPKIQHHSSTHFHWNSIDKFFNSSLELADSVWVFRIRIVFCVAPQEEI